MVPLPVTVTTVKAGMLNAPVAFKKLVAPPVLFEPSLAVGIVPVTVPRLRAVTILVPAVTPVVPAWAMVVALLPELVTSPVISALVVTVPAVKFAAVPEILVPTNALGVPKAGVTKVGEVAKTTLPKPVMPEPAEFKAAPTETPAAEVLATVLAVPAVKLAAVPDILVPTNALGVPKAGATKVGDEDKTTAPDPVTVPAVLPAVAEVKAVAIWLPAVLLLAILVTAVEEIVTSPVTVCGDCGAKGVLPVK